MLNKNKCGLHKTGVVVQGTRTCGTHTRRTSTKFVKKIKGRIFGTAHLTLVVVLPQPYKHSSTLQKQTGAVFTQEEVVACQDTVV